MSEENQEVHFSLVTAVATLTHNEVEKSKVVQFVHHGDTNIFPLRRLDMIQRHAAREALVRLEIPEEDEVTFQDIHLREILYLGQMTHEEFNAGIEPKDKA